MNALLLFGSTFVLVFALGLQTQLTYDGYYKSSFANSLLISVAQLGALQIVHANTVVDYAAYLLGGPIGIVTSMYIFRNHIKKVGKPA